MRRRVLAVFSLASLILCVATAVLWVRSYSVFHSLCYIDDRQLENAWRCDLLSMEGTLGVCSFTYDGGLGTLPGRGGVDGRQLGKRSWVSARRAATISEPPLTAAPNVAGG